MPRNKNKLDGRFDARIVSLYSRGAQGSIPNNIKGRCSCYAFCYYDVIQISPVSINVGPLLKSAYTQARKESLSPSAKGCVFRQSLVAMTDIVSDTDPDACYGYTSSQINAFWKNSEKHPLFFMSMINLKVFDDLPAVWAEIRRRFPAKNHLVYSTFDHCDLILFSYGDSFQAYTDQIFPLYYGGEKGLEDVITIYSFTAKEKPKWSTEQFGALIRIGVRDYQAAISFRSKLEEMQIPFQANWLLGRNDISILCETATLSWLSAVRDALIDVEVHSGIRWYSTYDLTVFCPDNTNQKDVDWKCSEPDVDCTYLRQKMQDCFKRFKRSYLYTFQRLEKTQNLLLTPNRVWLRWLEESCALVASLMGSRLSSDLATCLVPQFLDLLDYATKLFSSKRLTTRNEIDNIHTSFITFFSNIAILVDSMNQTNRQFVQVPDYHLPSFEIPPQILAYYTVLSQKLRTVFQDDPGTIYSLSISPKLVNTLSVTSLALQEVLPHHQWISMSMDEASFYMLKLTTETIAHEISHFVGQDNRKRGKRKECMMKCALQLLFGELLQELYSRVTLTCSFLQNADAIPAPRLPLIGFEESVEIGNRLWQKAIEVCGPNYGVDQRLYSYELEDLLAYIPEEIQKNPLLAESFFQEIWSLIERHPAKFKKMIGTLQTFFRLTTDISLEKWVEEKNCESLIKGELHELFSFVLDDFKNEFKSASSDLSESSFISCQLIGKLSYMFRETFADLQAILLLDMDWEDYCGLLQREENRTLIEDCPLRMLAVTKVLTQRGKPLPAPDSVADEFKVIRDSVELSFKDEARTLAERGFNVTYLYYLEDYLSECAESIVHSLGNKPSLVNELKTLHKKLSDTTPIFSLQAAIQPLIEQYRSELLKK